MTKMEMYSGAYPCMCVCNHNKEERGNKFERNSREIWEWGLKGEYMVGIEE